jgi:hypothetical protein
LQASLFVYDEQAALTIQVVPSETHPVPTPAPVRATEQAALVASLKSPQTLVLHALFPVVYPSGKSKTHNPSVPSTHPDSTVYEAQAAKVMHELPLVVHLVLATSNA